MITFMFIPKMVSYYQIRTINNQTRKVFRNLAKFKALKVLQGIKFHSKISKLLKSYTWVREVKEEQLNSLRGKVSSNYFQRWTTIPRQFKVTNSLLIQVASSPRRRSCSLLEMIFWLNMWQGSWLLSNLSKKTCLKPSGFTRLRNLLNILFGMAQTYEGPKTTSSGKDWRAVWLKWKSEEDDYFKAFTRRSSRLFKRRQITWEVVWMDLVWTDKFTRLKLNNSKGNISSEKSKKMS
jgi:hypothetical protein